ncbi:MAG: FecR domain-containing protein [Deltaproteobacteria bacterium]|nr:FecR domain-containing protein [Deltaproteobacteria bacterium]
MKKEPEKHKIDDTKLTEAGEWVLEMHSDSTLTKPVDRLKDWLSQDPINESKLDLVNSVWNCLDELKDDPLTVQTIEKSMARERVVSKESWFKKLNMRFPRIRYAAVAVTVLLTIGAILLTGSNVSVDERFRTATGEQKKILLSDGSTIHLDTNTIVTTSYSKILRHIELDMGQALFSVAHEPDRPFIVTSGQITVRAIGTEFNVYKRKEGKVYIAVSKGCVQVSREAEAAPPMNVVSLSKEVPPPSTVTQKHATASPPVRRHLYSEIVRSGQEIVVDEQETDFDVKPADTSRISAWKDGRLDFEDMLLPDVIDELNRYLTQKFVIVDERLTDVTISLYFKISNQKDFIHTLAKVLPITYHITADGRVEISKKEV